MFSKLDNIVKKLNNIKESLLDKSVFNDKDKFKKLMKEQSELFPIVEKYEKYKKNKNDLEDLKNILLEEKDSEMKDMLKEEINISEKKLEELEKDLKIMLIPKDENDNKNVIIEIRSGTGGDEASLFVGDLYRMYLMYAEKNKYKTELVDCSENGVGGFKEISFIINGKGAYSKFKYEAGTHRVQRIPETESSGRVHTSAATVAVIPEADDVEVNIDMNDCRFDVFRSSGNGGQSVNTTDSAVRLTHIPTGIVISCQDERSQLKNKNKALKVLKSKLYELERKKAYDAESELRHMQIGSGDRSEKIRTYNFPQNRMTDHRIKFTSYNLDSIMNGNIDELISALISADNIAKLLKM